MTFESWLKKVDAALLQLCGMTHEDIPDWDYYNAFEDDMTPVRAAKKAITAGMLF